MQIGIVGSGNIGTDLLVKLGRDPELSVAGMAGIDPTSDGLARARDMGHYTTHEGLERLLDERPEINLVIDATSAAAHRTHSLILERRSIPCIDLTPAAIGPAVFPSVNATEHLDAREVNLVTCGAQATVPIVAAASSVARVGYAEIVSTISALSAGPGTRSNIDEFTLATAASLESAGGARAGKALMVLNPADPPIAMRNTVYLTMEGEAVLDDVVDSIRAAARDMTAFVAGYKLTSDPIFDGERLVTMIEVRGAGDYLPTYAGNLDIMTAAAVRVAKLYAQRARSR
jgi:acetaldehyde dehydrogenase